MGLLVQHQQLTDHHVDGGDVELSVVAIDKCGLELLWCYGAGLVGVHPVEVCLELGVRWHVGRWRCRSPGLVARHPHGVIEM